MQKTGEILEPESERQGLWAIDDTIARLPTNVRYTARTTERSVRLAVVELPEVVAGERARHREAFP